MGVAKSNLLVREFIKRRKEISSMQYFQIQRDILCEPIAEHFEEFNATQLHKYFLENGMFYPDAKIHEELKLLEKKRVWEILQTHYDKLRELWGGEDANIYVFPAERRNEIVMKDLKGKMGVSFHHVILLFLTKELTKSEIQALLTHEYNHVCRLATLQKKFHELTLLDSIIIEGLAEVAVELTVGETVLAPWVSMYTKEELLPYWLRVKRYLDTKGKDKHDRFLYGDYSGRGFPKWFGYSAGYLIVKAYLEKNNKITMKDLLKIDTKEILKASEFGQELR
ncbi:DUF2268 domain-containing protein [Anaerobacillus sp. CMMVII]|uniref:DUF2268 domain-containing protein n=1 Tax=Anaerobacillus sp. CMMVII TaxID=2755588 RepID=UPI0021B71EE7|nr:DUF2268 domain-containing protein [Anaerobacillus sp. CMMVII]MCT8140405.1 DUF2268 domain-containing protein [Anaerobacillus sp. CMMVII]